VVSDDDVYRPLFELGKRVREEVLGTEFVHTARQDADELGNDFQDVVTALVWGGVWSRPGLARRDRSLITIALMAAQNQLGPLRLHLAGAIRNGLTRDEVEEALIHVAAYAGFPTGMTARSLAQEVLGDGVGDD
jgi:4-carboxymuconolactone decarboxylase